MPLLGATNLTRGVLFTVRVLHLLEATGGGTRRDTLDLLPALHRAGVATELLFSPLRYPAFFADAARLRDGGVRTAALPMGRGARPLLDLRALRQLVAHLRLSPPDILHLHSFKAGLLGRMAVAILRRPISVVYTPHCIAYATGLPLAQRRVVRVLETLCAPHTTRFIAVSHHEARVLAGSGLAAAERIVTIINGVDADLFEPQMRARGAERQMVSAPFVVGCFGRLTAQKNQSLLLRTLSLLRREGVNAKLLLCGGGEDEAMLRALAEHLDLGSYIEWTGEVSDARPHYARCNVVASPSRWEGCPYAVLEAMATQLPVVGARVGGIPELLDGGAGIVVRETRARDWARELVALQQDEGTRAALSCAARDRVEREFTLQRMTCETLQVYQAALSA